MVQAISYEKLQKTRSGQTVYRVWGWPKRDGTFHIYASKMQFIGKRHKGGKTGQMGHPDFTFKKRNQNKPLNDGLQTYISGAEGIKTFNTMRKANKYIEEVNQGLHKSDLYDCIAYHGEFDRLDEYFDEPWEQHEECDEY